MDDDGDDEIFIEGLDPHRKLVITSEMNTGNCVDDNETDNLRED